MLESTKKRYKHEMVVKAELFSAGGLVKRRFLLIIGTGAKICGHKRLKQFTEEMTILETCNPVRTWRGRTWGNSASLRRQFALVDVCSHLGLVQSLVSLSSVMIVFGLTIRLYQEKKASTITKMAFSVGLSSVVFFLFFFTQAKRGRLVCSIPHMFTGLSLPVSRV